MNADDALKKLSLAEKIQRILKHCKQVELAYHEGESVYSMVVHYERKVVMYPKAPLPGCMPVDRSECISENINNLIDSYYKRMFVCPQKDALQWEPAPWVKEQYVKEETPKKETEK